jgi:hypothetical protein
VGAIELIEILETNEFDRLLPLELISNSKFWLVVFGEPYAGGVAPQAPIGGRYAALQTSHVGVNFAELPRCLNRCC